MVRIAITVMLLVLLPSAAWAQAEKRIALLIANQNYKPGVGALVNPLNDARVIGEALKTVGFEVLKPVHNGRRTDMLLAIHDFAAKLKSADANAVGFLYYSGHGIASAGENYLIPVDVDEPSTRLLSVAGVKHSEVLAILRSEAPNAAHYLVLDACRNTLQGARGGKGFVPLGQQSGVLVAFAAEPGKTASDTGQGSGPYAAALAAELVKPGLSDLMMFHRVRVAVIQKTSGDQVPWTEDGIQRRDRVMFGGKTKQAPAPPPQTQVSEAERTWPWIMNTTDQSVLENFIKQFGETEFGARARARLAELKKPQAAVVKPGAPSKPVPPPIPAVSTIPAEPTRCEGFQVLVGSERRCLKSKENFKECANCPEMVVVPSGRFIMGSPSDEPERQHRPKANEDQVPVTISKPIAVGRFAVTRGEFGAFVAATGHKMDGGCRTYIGKEFKDEPDRNWLSPGFAQNDRHPVVCVNWNDAKAYVTWLSKVTGKTYRLLSEAEREYVARAGTTTAFWWGSSITTVQANYDGSASPYKGGGTIGEWRKATVPVDAFSPNPWGLYNVHGNVWEWTEDCWNQRNAGNPGDGRPRIVGDCGLRVVRGGSWLNSPKSARSADRDEGGPTYRNDNRGLRVATTLD